MSSDNPSSDFGMGKLHDDDATRLLVRAALNSWAQSHANHQLSDLGDRVEIVDIHSIPSFWFQVESLYEQRRLERRTSGYRPASTVYPAQHMDKRFHALAARWQATLTRSGEAYHSRRVCSSSVKDGKAYDSEMISLGR